MMKAAMADFLEELIRERSARNSAFPDLVQAALDRRELIRELAATRDELDLSQTTLAALMGTSQSAVARVESGDTDVRLSTLARYAAAVGRRIEWRLVESS